MFRYFVFRRTKLTYILTVSVAIFLLWTGFRNRFSSPETSTPKPQPVPNVVHFVHFINREDGKHLKQNEDLDFVSATCILAAYLNQQPHKIVYHTNVNIDREKSTFWKILFQVITDSILEIRQTSRPTHVFGNRLTSVQHSSDVKRLQILQSEGGVTLDSDTFVISKLNHFFQFDCTIGWPKNQSIGNQIIIARPGARFIKLWLSSYRDYRPFMWYYNAGELPTQHILKKDPTPQ